MSSSRAAGACAAMPEAMHRTKQAAAKGSMVFLGQVIAWRSLPRQRSAHIGAVGTHELANELATVNGREIQRAVAEQHDFARRSRDEHDAERGRGLGVGMAEAASAFEQSRAEGAVRAT